MKPTQLFGLTLSVAALLAFAGTAKAGFVTLNTQGLDADCTYIDKDAGTISITAPISEAGAYEIDLSVDGDPTLYVDQTITNDSAFDWTSYVVTVTPGSGLLLSNLTALAPAFFPDILSTKVVIGDQIFYSGGVIHPGDTLETRFKFDITATSGSYGYTIENAAVGIPEPASLAVLGLSSMLFLARRRK